MSFLRGINFFFAGLKLAFSPDVRRFIVLPALVSFIIISSGLALGFSYVTDLSNYLLSSLPSWLSFLEWILEPLLYLMGLLIGAWSFGLIAAVVGSPFLGDLSIQVEQVDLEQPPWWKTLGPTLARELRKLAYHLPRVLLLLICSIIPVLNTLSPVLWLVFGAWMMAVQFCDYPTENRHHVFGETLAMLSQSRAGALGFGLCVTVGMSIPLLNFIIAPVAVIGGTLLMTSLRKDKTPAVTA